jgi:endogenous inhibitor of DNA gyrase (YacG/DUF329 family)
MSTPLLVICPHCGIEHPYDTRNPYRPFCSERCKMIDLGKWANEDYRVAVPAEEASFTDFPPAR